MTHLRLPRLPQTTKSPDRTSSSKITLILKWLSISAKAQPRISKVVGNSIQMEAARSASKATTWPTPHAWNRLLNACSSTQTKDYACSAGLSCSSIKATVWITTAPFPSLVAARDASTTLLLIFKVSATTQTVSLSRRESVSNARMDSHSPPIISAPNQHRLMWLMPALQLWVVMWFRMELAWDVRQITSLICSRSARKLWLAVWSMTLWTSIAFSVYLFIHWCLMPLAYISQNQHHRK